MKKWIIVTLLAVIALLGVRAGTASAGQPLPGDIKTTLPDGSVVNGNIYTAKCDVALNGGPSSQQSDHLPNGTYDVAVTDPSGGTVLGEGHSIVVIANGDGTFGPITLCKLVQPSPYDDSPNNGDEYKVWFCRTGFLYDNDQCKTDNFKVRQPTPTPTSTPVPPTATSTSKPPTPTPVSPTNTPRPHTPTATQEHRHTPTSTATPRPGITPIPTWRSEIGVPGTVKPVPRVLPSTGEGPKQEQGNSLTLTFALAGMVLGSVAIPLIALRQYLRYLPHR